MIGQITCQSNSLRSKTRQSHSKMSCVKLTVTKKLLSVNFMFTELLCKVNNFASVMLALKVG